MEKKDSVRSSDIACSHPYNSANWLSRLTVHWMSNVLQLGSKRPLEKKDLFSVRTEDSMEQLVDKLESEWKKEIINSSPTGCKPRLWKVLLRMFSWKEYTLLFVLKVLRFLSTIFLPTLLWFFLSDLEKETQSGYSAASFLFVTGIILLAIMKGLSKNHSSAMTEVMGNRLKVACIGFVYKKVSILGRLPKLNCLIFELYHCFCGTRLLKSRSKTFNYVLRVFKVCKRSCQWMTLINKRSVKVSKKMYRNKPLH